MSAARMTILTTTLLTLSLLVMHDLDANRHAKQEAASRAGIEHHLEQLQTDVSDLKQSVDALGVACESRR